MVTSHSVKILKVKTKYVVRCDNLNNLFNRSPKATGTYNFFLFLIITVYNNEEVKHNKVPPYKSWFFTMFTVFILVIYLMKVSCSYYKTLLGDYIVAYFSDVWMIHIPYFVYISVTPVFYQKAIDLFVRTFDTTKQKSMFRHLRFFFYRYYRQRT